MKRLSFALTSLLPRVRPAIAPLSMLAAPFRTQAPAIASFRALPLIYQKSFSSAVNSTLPSLSESSEVLNSQGSIRVRKALEIDGRSKMDAKEFLELCRQFCFMQKNLR
jgi:hypothetical protein